ncbi:alpha/beta hydrolase [Paractinoplanes durhamensis]|uniref:alpha/beta hydrolase n=1 Tax=Paractinoplanes durhamensis TaxID=113563 RepID=UPI00362B7A7F
MKTLLTVLMAAALPVPAPQPAALDWFTCGTAMDAQCTHLTVPVDWGDPGGAKIQLAVGRRPALDPDHKIGTLIFGPGGPWDPGVDRAVNGYHRFSDTLLDRFDIVSFDPRGSHGSHAVSCDPAQVAAAPYPVLSSQADFDATLAYNRELWAGCEQLTGDLWNHADMGSNVRDLDALRAALGERKLTFQGSSYGTLLGEAYAERYPGRVRAIVLESVDDHSSRSTAEFLTAQTWAAEDAFDAFVAWCDRTPACALHGRDVVAVWNRLYDSAVAGRPDFTPSTWSRSPTNAPRTSTTTSWPAISRRSTAAPPGCGSAACRWCCRRSARTGRCRCATTGSTPGCCARPPGSRRTSTSRPRCSH